MNEVMTAAERHSATNDARGRPIHALRGDLQDDEQVREATVFTEDGGTFRPAGDRTLRPYGGSTRVSLTRASLDLSGFDEDESVSVYARGGAILLVSNEAETPLGAGVVDGVEVVLDVANVPESVAATLDSYEAHIEVESVEVTPQGTLGFDVSLPSSFAFVTERDVRPFGDSTAFTLPPGSLDRAGLAEGDDVDVSAVEGAVLLSARDSGPGE